MHTDAVSVDGDDHDHTAAGENGGGNDVIDNDKKEGLGMIAHADAGRK